MPPDYAFELRVPPGQYVLSGSVYSGGLQAYGTGSISLTADLDGAVLTMRPAPDISSRIIIAEGVQANLKDVRITLAGISSLLWSGEFELREESPGRLNSFPMMVRRPGHFSIVNVRSLPDGYFIREVKPGGQDVSPDDFEIQGFAELDFVLSKYKLFAWEEVDDDLWQDPEFCKKYENRGHEVTIGPSEMQNVQLRVIAAEEVK
jgi:hypothetical protein